ncbi:MAG: CehA/McbA family metallohydrolase [Eubacteriales bacterium]
MKKRLISIVSLFLALLTVAACTPTVTPETTTDITTLTPETTQEVVVEIPEGIILAGGDYGTKVTVTCPDGFAGLLGMAEALAEYVNSVVPGASVGACFDNAQADTDYFIHIAPPDINMDCEYSLTLEQNTLTIKGQRMENISEALAYLKATAVKNGFFFIPEALSFSSGAGPELISHSPENLYYYEDVYTPELIFNFDGSKVAGDGCELVINGVDLTDKAIRSDGSLTLSGITFEPGDYSVFLTLADKDGNVEAIETSFSCGDASEMNLYCGEVHAHTSDSDGKLSVEDAYKYARDVAKLDFFAVTDHSDSFKNEVFQNKHLPNADSFNDPGTFAALYGYEQTYNIGTGYYGHLNTINRGSLSSRTLPLEEYYTLMAADPNAVVMFNHPGYKWGNFLELGLYSKTFDRVVNLAEIKGKGYDTEYALALTKGWHVSPVYNEDNHEANWGNAYEYCGYALAPSLTRQNIIEAFQKNRTYTTTDKSLKIYYKINDEWMGSRLQNPDKLKVSVQLSTEKSVGIGRVYLVAEDNIVVATKNAKFSKELSWQFEIDPLYDYYYIKVESIDGSTWCVTAPIWIEEREQLTVGELTQSLLINNAGSEDYRISVDVTNNSNEPMTNAVLKLYASTRSGFDEESVNPDKILTIGELKPGETKTVYIDTAYNYQKPAIYVTVSAKQGEKNYSAVRYLEISNIYFSEILPFTVMGGADAYEFIELYNNSDEYIDLSTYSIRYYTKAGAKADDLVANTWKLKGKIAPHSTMVVWVVSESSKLTVADFNKNYSTSLVEGESIIRVVGRNIPHVNPVQLEILRGTTVVGRCWYNWGENNDVTPNKALIFDYPTDYTFTAKNPTGRKSPTPGKLADGQMPELIG